MKTKWTTKLGSDYSGGFTCPKCGYTFYACTTRDEQFTLPKYCQECGEHMVIEDEAEFSSLDFLIAFGKAAEIFKDDMTIEEAINIINPENKKEEFLDALGSTLLTAKDIKARYVVIDFVKKKLQEEKKT